MEEFANITIVFSLGGGGGGGGAIIIWGGWKSGGIRKLGGGGGGGGGDNKMGRVENHFLLVTYLYLCVC